MPTSLASSSSNVSESKNLALQQLEVKKRAVNIMEQMQTTRKTIAQLTGEMVSEELSKLPEPVQRTIRRKIIDLLDEAAMVTAGSNHN